MQRILIILLCLLLAGGAAVADQALPRDTQTTPGSTSDQLTDAAIAVLIVAASIAAYRKATSGSCPCPDDLDKAGRRCGKRSAHSRGGGWTVLCSPADVTADMIAAHRNGSGKR